MAKRPTIQVSTHGTKPKRNPGDPVTHADVGTGTSVTSLPTAELKARDRNIEAPSRTFQRIITDDDNGGTKPPIPPDQIFHDFSKERLGPFTHTRGSIASGTGRYPDERNIINSSNTPIYTGDRLNPPSTWFDEMLCYGIQVEPYSENRLKYSNDLANAVWAKANTSASSEGLVTASADNATISQAFDLGSATPGVFSGYATSVTAATSIEVSSDGTNWTSITLSGQTRFALPTSTQTGTCWVRLQTSGDQVKINWVQLEPSPNGQPTSWIPTYATAPIGRGRTVVETPGTGDGAANGFSLQVTATALGDSSKHPDATAPFFSVISTDYSCRLTAYHDTVGGTVNLTWENNAAPETLTGPAFTSVLNDAIDIKLRKSADEGLVLSVNGTKASFPTYTDFFAQPLKRLRVGSDLNDTALHEFQWIRFDPTGVSQVEVDTWPVWTQPLPIIEDPQPQSIQFPVTTPPVDVGVPTIDGDPIVDSTLTANISAMSDPDGITAHHYVWSAGFNEVQAGASSTYVVKSGDVGLPISLAFSYENTDGTPRGPVAADEPTAPVTEGTQPPVTGTPVSINNYFGRHGGQSHLCIDEGGSGYMALDVRNGEHAILEYIPHFRPGNHTYSQFDVFSTPLVEFADQIPGVTFNKRIPIPQYEPGTAEEFPPNGRVNDTNGDRWEVRVDNARYGDDCDFNIKVWNDSSPSVVDANGTRWSYRLKIRKKATYSSMEDVGSLYGYWSIEEIDPQEYRRNQLRKLRVIQRWSRHITNTDYNYPYGQVPYVKSIAAEQGTGTLIPHGNDTESENGIVLRDGYFIQTRMAAKVGAAGLRHTRPAGKTFSSGVTFTNIDWRFLIDDVGCTIEVLDSAGGKAAKVYTTATNNNYWLALGGAAGADTGIPVDPCEAVIVVLGFSGANVTLTAHAIDNPADKVVYTTAHGLGSAEVGTLSFCAEADDPATNSIWGCYTISCCHDRYISEAELPGFYEMIWDLIFHTGAVRHPHRDYY